MAEIQEKKTADLGPKELPAVASKFFYSCKKCEEDRFHNVLAHSTASSAKLECEVCGKKVTWRLPKKKKISSGKKVRKTRSRSSKASQDSEMWVSLKERMGNAIAKPYDMTTQFQVSSAIHHSKFGLGFVMLAQVKKIEVSFENGIKVLVHNRS